MWRGAHAGTVAEQRDMGLGEWLPARPHNDNFPSDKATEGRAPGRTCGAPDCLWSLPQPGSGTMSPRAGNEAYPREMQSLQSASHYHDRQGRSCHHFR